MAASASRTSVFGVAFAAVPTATPMLADTDQLVLPDHDRLAEGVRDPLGDADGVLLAGDVLAQHDELVAAEAGHGLTRPPDRVAVAQHAREPGGERDQQLVTDLVPERRH